MQSFACVQTVNDNFPTNTHGEEGGRVVTLETD